MNETLEHGVSLLGDLTASTAIRAALAYLDNHGLTCRPEALRECLRAHIKAAAAGALRDAQDALACGMTDAALATFQASIALAGIEAAKECGFPASNRSEPAEKAEVLA